MGVISQNAVWGHQHGHEPSHRVAFGLREVRFLVLSVRNYNPAHYATQSVSEWRRLNQHVSVRKANQSRCKATAHSLR